MGHRKRQTRLDRDVGGRTDDLLPWRPHNNARSLGIKPEIELVTRVIDELDVLSLRRDASAHEDQLLGQFGELRIERNGEGEVSHGTAFVDRDLVRILSHHPKQKMRSIFIGGVGGRPPFPKLWGDERVVPPVLVPRGRVGDFSLTPLPFLTFFVLPAPPTPSTRQY